MFSDITLGIFTCLIHAKVYFYLTVGQMLLLAVNFEFFNVIKDRRHIYSIKPEIIIIKLFRNKPRRNYF